MFGLRGRLNKWCAYLAESDDCSLDSGVALGDHSNPCVGVDVLRDSRENHGVGLGVGVMVRCGLT